MTPTRRILRFLFSLSDSNKVSTRSLHLSRSNVREAHQNSKKHGECQGSFFWHIAKLVREVFRDVSNYRSPFFDSFTRRLRGCTHAATLSRWINLSEGSCGSALALRKDMQHFEQNLTAWSLDIPPPNRSDFFCVSPMP